MNDLLLINSQMSTFASSQSPKYWTNPEEFNPYRFDDEEVLKRYWVDIL